MKDDRSAMNDELKGLVVPMLRSLGFKGSLPHFRRANAGLLEVLTFQFDRYGGGFVVEVAQCNPEGFLTTWGKEISANKVTAWDLPSSWRYRIQSQSGSGTESWFRFENGKAHEAACAVANKLKEIEAWFKTEALRINPADRPKRPPKGPL